MQRLSRRAVVLPVVLVGVAAWPLSLPSGEIHEAVKDGKLEEVKQLLAAEPNLVNAKDEDNDDMRPLHHAAKEARIAITKLLIANKATVDAKDKKGRTPLHYAAQEGHEGHKAVAEILVANKADVNVKDSEGTRPLHLAAESGNKDFVLFLIQSKAEVKVEMDNSEGPHPTRRYTPPLHLASTKEAAEALLANNADVDAIDGDGDTALHEAAWRGKIDIAKVLIAYKANVNAKGKDGETPLFKAAGEGREEMVKFLIENKADVNAKGKNGETALWAAARFGGKDVVEILLAHGADANIKTFGQTPLDAAIEVKADDIVKILRGQTKTTSE